MAHERVPHPGAPPLPWWNLLSPSRCLWAARYVMPSPCIIEPGLVVNQLSAGKGCRAMWCSKHMLTHALAPSVYISHEQLCGLTFLLGLHEHIEARKHPAELNACAAII